jgi:glycyl-tRNA synthetase beta chain
MNDLLLEIGCENLPPLAIRPAFEQLGADAKRCFEELRLGCDTIYATGSPRRLVLIASGLAAAQTVQFETVTGPPVAKSYDEDGRPTRAAVGFAKSHGRSPAQLKRIRTDRGEYLGFTRRLKAHRTTALLKRVVPELIAGLRFPKMMHWESEGFRFARPIRWLVCLYGTTIVHFKVAGVGSGNVTHTNPWIRRDRLRVKGADHYLQTMKKASVVVDHVERRRLIESLARKAAARAGLRLIEDDELFDELTFMLEEPRIITGDFDPEYLKLPPEVVVTAMKAHQRYLALRGERKRLVPKFLAFTEGRVRAPAEVRRGNEKVLRARLEDAQFYWQEDLKTGIQRLAERLRSIVFIEGLGSLQDKAERMRRLALLVCDTLPSAERIEAGRMERAAYLAKADIASEMVKDGKEFTRLEGLIGSHYALHAREDGDIVTAIREHLLPRTPSDPLPTSELAAVLGIADRMDTITGCFIAGLIPTGSQDPHGLRRLANGLLRILETREEIGIDHLGRASLDAYLETGLAVGADRDEILRQQEDFFKARSDTFLKERGIAYDVVAAVSAVAWSRPGTALKTAHAIQSLRGDEAFERLITGVKRVGNILERPMRRTGADWNALQEAFFGSGALAENIRFSTAGFQDSTEKLLHEEIRKTIPHMLKFEEKSDVVAILKTLSTLGGSIDAYFDGVLVNCDDLTLRTNRHHFLSAVFALFSRYADFSNIVEETRLTF